MESDTEPAVQGTLWPEPAAGPSGVAAGTGTAVGKGPRAVEAALLAELSAECDRAEAQPALLARPLRVVVPSQALRQHLCHALVDAAGRARLGVSVQTLDALARDVLARAGDAVPSALLYPAVVRDRARREPGLARDLERLDDGFAGVVASVDDLLDAGFTADHLEPLEERLAEAAAGPLGARGTALLRVAADVSRELAGLELGHRSAVLVRATERLAEAGAAWLPTRALWLHGFADATGVQLDLLDALARCVPTRVCLGPTGGAGAAGFGARLRERLAPWLAAPGGPPVPEPEVVASRHADVEAEYRAAAVWAYQALADGHPPERIAIVARDLAGHRLGLRRQLRRLGVPFSGVAARGGAGPVDRRLGALRELLERGGELPAERWLDALDVASPSARADLRDALHGRGIATLADLAAAPGAGAAKLDARTGFALDAEGRPRASRRRVAPERLAALGRTARAVLRQLDAEPARAPLGEWLERLAALTQRLGWSGSTLGRDELEAAFADADGAGGRPIGREDWLALLGRQLADAGTDPLGGRGGGVQVLGVMEARARSFVALRVVGLNRGVFPRSVSEDPLLPDALRRALRDVLPDLPVKSEGHEEERYLFTQLLAAAPRVHLSCALRNAAGRPAPASPLFERAPGAAAQAASPRVESSADALLRIALECPHAAFAAALPEALAEGRRAAGLPGGPVAPSLVAARLAVLAELDAPPGRGAALGPYLGRVGPVGSPADPRRRSPWVTDLERLVKCPWQTFLSKLLELSPVPDVWGPLPAAAGKRLLGEVVHEALEMLCDPDRPDSEWPEVVASEVVRAAAERRVRREGIPLPGFAAALARRAAGPLEVARRLDRADPVSVLGVERRDEVEVSVPGGEPRVLRFRADRFERSGEATRLTDWKTGKLPLDQKDEGRRSRAYEQRLQRGELLQAHAYSLTGSVGRFVYLAEELDDALRIVEARPQGSQREAFERSVGTLLRAREAGAFPPRLREPARDEEPKPCRSCEVKQACLRGDSGVRRRLGRWAESNGPGDALEDAARTLWRLPETEA